MKLPLNLFLSGILLFSAHAVSAQTDIDSTASDDVVILSEENRPQFKGGDEALQKFIQKNLHYPESARKKKIQGDVIVGFTINEKGECSNFKIVKSLDRACDAAAIKALKDMPRWKPAKVNSVAIATQMKLPVSFRLNNTLILEDNSKTKNKYR